MELKKTAFQASICLGVSRVLESRSEIYEKILNCKSPMLDRRRFTNSKSRQKRIIKKKKIQNICPWVSLLPEGGQLQWSQNTSFAVGFSAGEELFLYMQAHFSVATGIVRVILLMDDRQVSQQKVFQELQLVSRHKCV